VKLGTRYGIKAKLCDPRDLVVAAENSEELRFQMENRPFPAFGSGTLGAVS